MLAVPNSLRFHWFLCMWDAFYCLLAIRLAHIIKNLHISDFITRKKATTFLLVRSIQEFFEAITIQAMYYYVL